MMNSESKGTIWGGVIYHEKTQHDLGTDRDICGMFYHAM